LWSEDDHGRSDHSYDLADFLQDLRAGHNFVATVFIDCFSHYRKTGPPQLAPVGETEWAMTQRTSDGVIAGIVSFANMYLGAGAAEVLEAHKVAGGKVFKGIRHSVAWDQSPDVNNAMRDAPEHALVDETFQAGVAELAKAGLVFETWCYFHQLDELAQLAGKFPDLTIVLDHLGGPVVIGPYAGHRPEMLEGWHRGFERIAQHPNVFLKLGGIGYRSFVEPSVMAGPRSSEWLAEYWRPEILFCIQTLGPERCMFESNFPVDHLLCDYVTMWNVFKRITAELSPDERALVFEKTARKAYSL
jgi:predicted TIM-barrel fold metal-dependent hydrolase